MGDINKERHQKDLIQLQRLIDAHFGQRKKDEEELEALRLRIEERKAKRAVEMQERAEKEKEKVAREREERKLKEAEEEEKRKAEEDKKKQILAERRKPLNIDHLGIEKIREKVTEFWTDLYALEEEKYDMEQRITRQKYDINQLRQRVSEYMGKFSKNKRAIKVGTSVAGAKSAFS